MNIEIKTVTPKQQQLHWLTNTIFLCHGCDHCKIKRS